MFKIPLVRQPKIDWDPGDVQLGLPDNLRSIPGRPAMSPEQKRRGSKSMRLPPTTAIWTVISGVWSQLDMGKRKQVGGRAGAMPSPGAFSFKTELQHVAEVDRQIGCDGLPRACVVGEQTPVMLQLDEGQDLLQTPKRV